jgi:tetratricopeptide (TPR) repeat protein
MTFLNIALALLFLPPATAGQVTPIELYHRGDFQRAAEILTQEAGAIPAAADKLLWLGKAYLKLRKWDSAIEALKRAVMSNPASSLYHLWLGRAYGEKAIHVSFLRASFLARKVLQEFETAGRLDPDSVEARFDLLQYYLEAPGILGGGRDKADEQVRAIELLDRRSGYRARALMFQQEKDWVQARIQYERAVSEFGSTPDAYLELASFLFDRSDFSGALVQARKALALKSSFPDAELLIGKIQVRLGADVGDAEARLRRLAAGSLGDDDPTFDDVYYWLGEALLAGAKRAEAKQAFETALRFNPDHTAAKSALARIS